MIADSTRQIVFAVTSAFEGRGFDQITGNFDGQVLSCGMFQWNLGQGSLQPLLRWLFDEDSAAVRGHVGLGVTVLRDVADNDMPLSQAAMEFTGKGLALRARHVVEPWLSRLRALFGSDIGRRGQLHFAEPLLQQAATSCRDFGLVSIRALSLMLDITVQNGGISFRHRAAMAPGLKIAQTEVAKLETIARVRASFSRLQYRADVLARKLCIVRGVGKVHGVDYDLARDFGLSDAPFEG